MESAPTLRPEMLGGCLGDLTPGKSCFRGTICAGSGVWGQGSGISKSLPLTFHLF